MTQKHFVAIAAILAGQIAVYRHSVREQLATREVALSMADYFASENPRFKRDTFYLACGLDKEGFLNGEVIIHNDGMRIP